MGETIRLLQIKELTEGSEDNAFKHLYSIVRFDYEEGYSYILQVRIEPNEHAKYASSEAYPYIYTHIKTILKEKVN